MYGHVAKLVRRPVTCAEHRLRTNRLFSSCNFSAIFEIVSGLRKDSVQNKHLIFLLIIHRTQRSIAFKLPSSRLLTLAQFSYFSIKTFLGHDQAQNFREKKKTPRNNALNVYFFSTGFCLERRFKMGTPRRKMLSLCHHFWLDTMQSRFPSSCTTTNADK